MASNIDADALNENRWHWVSFDTCEHAAHNLLCIFESTASKHSVSNHSLSPYWEWFPAFSNPALYKAYITITYIYTSKKLKMNGP